MARIPVSTDEELRIYKKVEADNLAYDLADWLQGHDFDVNAMDQQVFDCMHSELVNDMRHYDWSEYNNDLLELMSERFTPDWFSKNAPEITQLDKDGITLTVPELLYAELKLYEFPSFGPNGWIEGMREQYYGENALIIMCGEYGYKVDKDTFNEAQKLLGISQTQPIKPPAKESLQPASVTQDVLAQQPDVFTQKQSHIQNHKR